VKCGKKVVQEFQQRRSEVRISEKGKTDTSGGGKGGSFGQSGKNSTKIAPGDKEKKNRRTKLQNCSVPAMRGGKRGSVERMSWPGLFRIITSPD